MFYFDLKNSDETVLFGKALGRCFIEYLNQLDSPLVIYLSGELGAGKTTLTRGVLKCFDHHGAVKSPTYTLVEPYEFDQISVYHFDLYRISDPDELEYMGIRDYFHKKSVSIIEWANKGASFLPKPDLEIDLNFNADFRKVDLQFINPVLKKKWMKNPFMSQISV